MRHYTVLQVWQWTCVYVAGILEVRYNMKGAVEHFLDFFLFAVLLATLMDNPQRVPCFSGNFPSSGSLRLSWTPIFGIYIYMYSKIALYGSCLHHFGLFS